MSSEAFYQNIIDHLEDGVYFVDQDRRFTLWNAAAERITGYTLEEIVGQKCHDNILDHIDMDGKPLCMLGCPLFETLGDGQNRIEEVMLRHRDGHRIAVLVKALPIFDGSEIIGAAEVFTPRSSLASDGQLVDSLTDKVMNDALTGLPNRIYLESFFDYKMQEFKRFGNFFCVVFMDIDNFRLFNNDFGHHVGDKVLTSIAESFKQNLREVDAMGRWGGEEFLGVFSVRNPYEACIVAEKVRTLVNNSEILHKGERISVTCSVGAACVQSSDTLNSIVERADAMMYETKNRGKNGITVDNPEAPGQPFTCVPVPPAPQRVSE